MMLHDNTTTDTKMKIGHSTTAKITKAAREAIDLSLSRGEGVIVRHKGVEYGIYAKFGGVVNYGYRCVSSNGEESIQTVEWLFKSTIRKGTVDAIIAAHKIAA
jgi:hypothetical protein